MDPVQQVTEQLSILDLSRVQSWSEDIRNLLDDKYGFDLFLRYLEEEDADNPTWKFWFCVNGLQIYDDGQALLKTAKKLAKVYIKGGLIKDLPDHIRNDIMNRYNDMLRRYSDGRHPTNDEVTHIRSMFDTAKTFVEDYHLPSLYANFLKSDRFIEQFNTSYRAHQESLTSSSVQLLRNCSITDASSSLTRNSTLDANHSLVIEQERVVTNDINPRDYPPEDPSDPHLPVISSATTVHPSGAGITVNTLAHPATGNVHRSKRAIDDPSFAFIEHNSKAANASFTEAPLYQHQPLPNLEVRDKESYMKAGAIPRRAQNEPSFFSLPENREISVDTQNRRKVHDLLPRPSDTHLNVKQHKGPFLHHYLPAANALPNDRNFRVTNGLPLTEVMVQHQRHLTSMKDRDREAYMKVIKLMSSAPVTNDTCLPSVPENKELSGDMLNRRKMMQELVARPMDNTSYLKAKQKGAPFPYHMPPSTILPNSANESEMSSMVSTDTSSSVSYGAIEPHQAVTKREVRCDMKKMKVNISANKCVSDTLMPLNPRHVPSGSQRTHASHPHAMGPSNKGFADAETATNHPEKFSKKLNEKLQKLFEQQQAEESNFCKVKQFIENVKHNPNARFQIPHLMVDLPEDPQSILDNHVKNFSDWGESPQQSSATESPRRHAMESYLPRGICEACGSESTFRKSKRSKRQGLNHRQSN